MRHLDDLDRQPEWIARLETEEYAPVAWVAIVELTTGDIIDVRDLGVMADEGNAYLTIDLIHRDETGMHGFSGKLPRGTVLNIFRSNGVPMNRRRIVRYVRRAPI